MRANQSEEDGGASLATPHDNQLGRFSSVGIGSGPPTGACHGGDGRGGRCMRLLVRGVLTGAVAVLVGFVTLIPSLPRVVPRVVLVVLITNTKEPGCDPSVLGPRFPANQRRAWAPYVSECWICQQREGWPRSVSLWWCGSRRPSTTGPAPLVCRILTLIPNPTPPPRVWICVP